MCGRTACACDPQTVARACTYKSRQTGTVRQPRWIDGEGRRGVGGPQGRARFYPSFNIGPHTYSPVLLSSKHEHCQAAIKEGSDAADCETGERVLQTMRWGLVPSWHKGDPETFTLMLNNCRSESITEKASFRNPLNRGQRCVVVVEGFYEWKSEPGSKSKQPYFIYFKEQGLELTEDELDEAQAKANQLDLEEAKQEEASEDGTGKDLSQQSASQTCSQEHQPKRLLTLAGLFDKWTPRQATADDSRPLFTYTIVTVPASPPIQWLHHRMPAVLDGEEAIDRWLDFGQVPTDSALQLIKPTDCLKWHPVTQSMNNVRYKNPDCIIPVDLSAKEKKATALTSWLKQSPKKTKKEDKSLDTPDAKRPKAESSS